MTSHSPSALPANDTEVLARDLRLFFGAFRRRLAATPDSAELTPSQVAVVLRLDEMGEATTSALSRAEGVRPQSMAAIVGALEAAGFIASAPDPQDGRKTLLYLSERGAAWLAEGRAARQDWVLNQIEECLTDAERMQVIAAMPLLQKLVTP